MRIESSVISMAATRNYAAEAEQADFTVSRRYSGDTGTVTGTKLDSYTNISERERDASAAVFTTDADGMERIDTKQVQESSRNERTREAKETQNAQPVVAPPRSGSMFSALSTYDNSYLKGLFDLLERITGGKIKWRDTIQPKTQQRTAPASGYRVSFSQASMRYQETVAMVSGETKDVGDANAAVIRQAAQNSSSGGTPGYWTKQTVSSGFVAGREHTAFCSTGTAVSADGRTINFNINVEMSRSFEAAYVTAGKEEVFTDPLVINLNTDAAQVEDVSFLFDLDGDGEKEEISALGEDSGFLALDKNGDGEINDGTELFGAQTGSGFGELAEYDEDGNGWIDEGDAVFSQLKVWVKAGGHEAQLLSLKEADVGAIFLGSQKTQYALTNTYGETGAMIRRTGLYLRESGSVGTVQHMDFRT